MILHTRLLVFLIGFYENKIFSRWLCITIILENLNLSELNMELLHIDRDLIQKKVKILFFRISAADVIQND